MVTLKKCEVCGKEFKNLGVHMRKHAARNSSSASTVSEEEVHSSKSHRFISPRASALHIVIRPTRQGFVMTTSGVQMSTEISGKSVTFVNGELNTADPEVIKYLTEVYGNRRYPVVDMTETEEIARTSIGA